MSGHTPGPWHIHTRHSSEIVAPDATLVALVLGSEQSFQTWEIDPAKAKLCHYPERCANARLIAAAPDLLEAGEALLAAAERHIFSDECSAEREAFRAAIAKARGEDTQP